MKKSILTLVVAFIFVGGIAPAQAVEYLDIDQPIGPSGTSILPGSDWQQTFTAVSNNVTAISIFLYAGPGTITIELLDSVCGTVLNQGTASGSGWVKCDMLGAEAVVPGGTYTMKLTGVGVVPFHLAVNGNPYAGGVLYRNCAVLGDGFADLKFQVWAETQPVSTEGSAWGAVKTLFR